MSLFDLQDVRIAIGSIAALDLPMVVDLIGIYGLKGPYCMLTTTNYFLQALSVIPRGSWGDVARRFTMVRWATASSPLHIRRRRRPSCAAPAAARIRRKIVSGQFDEENPFVLISSVLLVQADKGVSFFVVDRIGDIYRNLPRRVDVIVTTVEARYKCQQESKNRNFWRLKPPAAACDGAYLHARARAKPRDRAAHSLRTAADSWPLLHVRLSHVAGQGLREACPKLRAAGCGGVARWSRFMPMLHARRWPIASAACCATTCDDGRTKRRCRSTLEARWARDGFARFAHGFASPWRGVSHAVAVRFVGGGRRPAIAPAMLRRVSGDVVTAGLISSRVWFGPVPGSP
ncbi:hypothetical protein F511_43760 [Dorcoceras hygrometricum]|uniref:Uncharacterized protein n=1 Tax=Dorcoceras hygrometricum TaxID=472368 RepID=A0A2Z6ZYX5_9LAMI|nr:hypothetical protein F511_43760 [Dorcoceras hygrometricum]